MQFCDHRRSHLLTLILTDGDRNWKRVTHNFPDPQPEIACASISSNIRFDPAKYKLRYKERDANELSGLPSLATTYGIIYSTISIKSKQNHELCIS